MINQNKQERLYSKDRLDSFGGIESHQANLILIKEITDKIAEIEIILRNKIDYILSQTNPKWLEGKSVKVGRERIVIPKMDNQLLIHLDSGLYSKSQIISKQSLGFWFQLAKDKKIMSRLFTRQFLKEFDFRVLFSGNINEVGDKGNRKKLRQQEKSEVIFGLFCNLRNRAFHWENLFKIKDGNPQLKKYFRKTNFSLHYDKIYDFLNILLRDLYKDEEMGEDKIPQSPLKTM